MSEPATESRPELKTPAEAVQGAIERLTAEVDARSEALKALKSLARPGVFEDLELYRKTLAKAQKALGGEGKTAVLPGLEATVAELEGYAAKAVAEQRRRFGRELKQLCEAEHLAFRVVRSEEPIELRISPLSVEVDYTKGHARLSFSRNVLAECAADAREVIAAHRAALRELETPFDPAAFFESCWGAYRSTLAATSKRLGERVELLDFLPRLALELQPKRFCIDPRKEHFVDYPRARFAYDILRLKRAGALEQSGRRIQLGVATGTSATQKDRVVYFEDEEGRGEYKLTVFFRTDGKEEG